MIDRKILTFINLCFSVVALLLAVVTVWFCIGWWWGPQGMLPETEPVRERRLGRNPFEQKQESYDAIDERLLRLKHLPPQLSLPDLRSTLTYIGTNGRPDADTERLHYHLLLKGDASPHAVEKGETAYLVYSTDEEPPRYMWSPNNRTTRLWIELLEGGDQVILNVKMRGIRDEIIDAPSELASFSLKERPQGRSKKERWTLGQWRVDGTLLARQRARWYGRDLFFADHGGDDYAQLVEKERIDFGEGDTAYSVWIGEEDCLMWDGKRWQQVDLSSHESQDHLLLCLNKLGEKVMSFQIWDVDGRRKAMINLIRSTEMWQPTVLEKEFRFSGARTRSQSVVEIRGERQTLRLHDWLVLVDGEWKKLVTAEEIDSYVDRRVAGPLFIVEGVEKQEGTHVLRATLYNTSRTARHEFTLGSQQNNRTGSLHRGSATDDTTIKDRNRENELLLRRKISVPDGIPIPDQMRDKLPPDLLERLQQEENDLDKMRMEDESIPDREEMRK